MIGYKAFDENLCCRGFQFEVGKTYDTGVSTKEMELCTSTVFHFCRDLYHIDIVTDYKLSESRLCEVIAGEVVCDDRRRVFGTNRLTILREITGDEKNSLINTGRHNTGSWNTGSYNTGNHNVGSYNSGSYNTGNENAGWHNVGSYNTGSHNAGNSNVGSYNTGHENAGDWNTGNDNTGHENVGNCNTGSHNTGHENVGNCNTGNGNTGSCNTNNSNVGNYNTGRCNIGNHNTGNWNTGNWNTGFFNTAAPTVRMFNRDTGLGLKEIEFPQFLYFNLTEWVSKFDATPEEASEHSQEIEAVGGFLKKLSYKEAFRIAWDKVDVSEHKKLLGLPNWDNEIFKEISGINAEAEIAMEESVE